MMRISEYISLVTAETECFIHFPKVEFLFLNVIPPVRNKVNSTDLCGPSSQAKWVNGSQTGRIVFRFME